MSHVRSSLWLLLTPLFCCILLPYPGFWPFYRLCIACLHGIGKHQSAQIFHTDLIALCYRLNVIFTLYLLCEPQSFLAISR